MFKSKYDILFGFCISFIIILAVYLGYQRTQQNNLDDYLQLLKDKIASMISEEDKEDFNQFFSDFSNGLKDNSVSPGEVEKLAENIIELRKRKTSLSKEDLSKLLPSFRSQAVISADIFRFDYLNVKDWKKLAANFNKSFIRCDSIRITREKSKKLHDRLKKQIEIHTQISEKLKRNSLQAIEKFEEIKKVEIDAEIEKALLQEIEKLKLENLRIHDKLSTLDEMQVILDKEKRMLQKQIQYIDSVKSITL